MQCQKCGSSFPRSVFIDGKQRNLQNRKFCLKCSPFGQHNTTDLGTREPKTKEPRCCRICNKLIVRHNETGKLCWSCTNRRGRQIKIKKLQEFVGDSCWFCGYDRCWAALEFHHVHPETKLFALTTREMQFAWSRIYDELQKCVLACACCHREIHAGLIEHGKVDQLWKERWAS